MCLTKIGLFDVSAAAGLTAHGSVKYFTRGLFTNVEILHYGSKSRTVKIGII